MKNPVKWDMAGTKDLIFTQLVIFFTKCETSCIWFIQFSAGTVSGGTTNTAIHDEWWNVRLAVFDLFNLVLELLVMELPILRSMMNFNLFW